MNATDTLLIVVGLFGGFALGYVTAWRFARKLERHQVVLSEWDQPYDAHAPTQWWPGDRRVGQDRKLRSGGA